LHFGILNPASALDYTGIQTGPYALAGSLNFSSWTMGQTDFVTFTVDASVGTTASFANGPVFGTGTSAPPVSLALINIPHGYVVSGVYGGINFI
jgi:hypothetical protein